MALEIFRLVGSVFVDTYNANKSIQKTDKNASGLGKTLIEGVKSVGKFATAVTGVVAAAGAGIVALTESTREYRAEQGKLQSAFQAAGFESEAARKTYESLNGVLGDSGQAVEASTHLAKLCKSEEDLAKWTDICTGVYATFNESLPIEGLTEAVNETMRTGQVTGGLADAINWAAKSGETFGVKLKKNTKANEEWNKAVKAATTAEDYFNLALQQCSTEQERQALITKTLNGMYSEASDTYKEVNADVIAANEAQDRMNKAMADAGAAFEPVVTWGKELVSGFLEKALPHITALGEKAVPALSTALETTVDWIGQAVQWAKDAVTWMQENETIVTLIAIALGTFTAALVAYTVAQNAATIATTVATTAATIAAAATTAWGAATAFLTAPITLIILAIGALIAIVYLLVTHWDTVKAVALDCWEWIKSAWSKAAEWFNEKVVKPVSKFFADAGAAIRKAFSDAWAWVKSVWSGVTGFFSGIWSGIKNTFSNVTGWFKDTFSKAWSAVKNVFSTGGKIFDGIKEGIASTFKTVVNGLIGGINKVISVPFTAINNALSRIKNIEILKLRPFSWITTFSIPQIPKLERGAVLERGQVGLLEGNGAEAVVPLERNKKWTQAVAQAMDGALGGASAGAVLAVLQDILAAIEALAAMGIYLDTEKLVGGIAKPMDRKLGQLQAQKARG